MVRGEVFLPWGVAEAETLGLEQALLDAGGGYATRLGRFEEWIPPDEAESQAIPLDRLLPGVPGSLNVGHPEACEAPVRAAAAAGARVVRQVGEVTLGGPDRPSVSTSSTTSTTRSVVGWWWGLTVAGRVSAARPGSAWRSPRLPAWPAGCSLTPRNGRPTWTPAAPRATSTA